MHFSQSRTRHLPLRNPEEAMQKVPTSMQAESEPITSSTKSSLPWRKKNKETADPCKGLAAADMHELMFIYELKERLTVCLTVIAICVHARRHAGTVSRRIWIIRRRVMHGRYVNSKKNGTDYDDPQRSGERRRNPEHRD